MMLYGLPPVVNRNTRLLVLGSFPGAASLAAQQYYAHPQNNFWRIWGDIWGDLGGDVGCGADSKMKAQGASGLALRERPYAQRIAAARRHGLGLWDVYACCERTGSLDAAIRNAQLNDFASLKRRCPNLRVVAHNGAESAKHAHHIRALLPASVEVIALPSSSPANASQSYAFKLSQWHAAWRRAQ